MKAMEDSIDNYVFVWCIC